MSKTRPRGVHLVGSAPFATPADLFRSVGRELGTRLSRLPDGEPGTRSWWIYWQLEFLASSPALELVPGYYGDGRQEVRLKPGADPADVEFEDLGYANEAIASYEAFREAKQAGHVPEHVRFQVSLPTPFDVLAGAVVTFDTRALIEPPYEAAMLRELERICAEIPHDQLAIQWDLCMATLLWEEDLDQSIRPGWWNDNLAHAFWGGRDGIVERSARMVNVVPPSVELGFHFCYGDYQSRHEIEPKDLGNIVELTTAVLDASNRPVRWLHMPVPIDRSDHEYFAPLADLRLPAHTEVYLGLLHLSDGEAGAAERIAAAQSVIGSFGVATECGWGRRAPEDAPELLRLHAATCEPVM